MRRTILAALLAMLVLAACRDGGQASRQAPAQGTATQAATPRTSPATATPTPTGPAGAAPALDRTGVPAVDRVIEAGLRHDAAALTNLVRIQTVQCVDPARVQGAGGPPACREGEVPGTPAQVFLVAGCEGSWSRDAISTITQAVARIDRLHAVMLQRAGVLNTQFPWGPFLVVFTSRERPDVGVVAFGIDADGRIRSHLSGCSGGAPAFLNSRSRDAEVILGPLD